MSEHALKKVWRKIHQLLIAVLWKGEIRVDFLLQYDLLLYVIFILRERSNKEFLK